MGRMSRHKDQLIKMTDSYVSVAAFTSVAMENKWQVLKLYEYLVQPQHIFYSLYSNSEGVKSHELMVVCDAHYMVFTQPSISLEKKTEEVVAEEENDKEHPCMMGVMTQWKFLNFSIKQSVTWGIIEILI